MGVRTNVCGRVVKSDESVVAAPTALQTVSQSDRRTDGQTNEQMDRNPIRQIVGQTDTHTGT